MICDLLYVSHNRLAFTQETFPALVKNTNWEHVARLHVLDDDSTDGTSGYLMSEVSELYARTGMKVDCISDRFGGPVAAMNHALDNCDSEVLAKIDSDAIVCSGWLDVMLDTLEAHPQIDALGMEPGFGEPLAPRDVPRRAQHARWIGGLGLIRTRVFEKRRPVASERFMGWTQFQREHVNAAWVTPDIPVFLLDHLPFEPWRSLAARYVAEGWSREWDEYSYDFAPYWEWWAPDWAPMFGTASA